jgi:Zincin-like metallopeptidase
MAYIVIKTIRGRRYKYWQRAWREGGRVRTQCRCLGRIDGEVDHGNTTPKGAPEPPQAEPWRVELKDGLREVVRRLEQEGNHYVVEQIAAIDVAQLSRDALLEQLRAFHRTFEGDNYAGEHLSETLASLVAFGNTTPEEREPWRTQMSGLLAIAETWMPDKASKAAVQTILDRLAVSEPERIISYLETLSGIIDEPSGQARKQLEGAIEKLRNTTGTHTDASLIEMLFSSQPMGQWQQPWSDTLSASGSVAIQIDPRVIAAPVKLGVTVKTLPFGLDSGMKSDLIDGAVYNPTRDTIRIPDATRYHTETNGISSRDLFEHNLLHETCHAAAHHTRLNLSFSTTATSGRSGYAACEVLTETAACLVQRKLGMKRPATWSNSVRYVQNWVKRARIGADDIRFLQSNALAVADYVTRHAESDPALRF